MTAPVTVHVRLLDEGVDVWRPVEAEHVSGTRYRIVAQPYDRELERWEFEPGDVVEVGPVPAERGTFTAALRLSDLQ